MRNRRYPTFDEFLKANDPAEYDRVTRANKALTGTNELDPEAQQEAIQEELDELASMKLEGLR